MSKGVAPKQIRVLTVALIVVALLLPGVQLLVRGANSVTDEVLEGNWRGAFDILVTDKEFEERVSPGRNEFDLAFLDPNYGGVAAPVISREKVAEVAGVAGVEVAAPLGYVGTQIDPLRPYHVIIPWQEFEVEKKRTFRLTSVATSSDGITERVERKTTNIFEIDVTEWNGKYGNVNFGSEGAGIEAIWTNYKREAAWYARPEGVGLLFLQLPTATTSIAAVDPVAEIKLLGEGSEFTQSLQRLQQAEDIFTVNGAVSAANYETWSKAHPAAAQQLDQFPGVEQLQDFARLGYYGFESELVPYIHSNKAYPANYIKTKFERKNDDDEYVEIGETEIDLSESYLPFGVFGADIVFPGSSVETENYHGITDLLGFAGIEAGALTLKPRVDENGAPGFEVVPKQITNIMEKAPDYKPTGELIGDVRDYRSAEEIDLKVGTRFAPGVAPYAVGSYEPVTKTVADVYTPLGLYENTPVVTRDGKTLAPSRTGAGLVLESADAIVSLSTAEKLVEGDFVTSVRVRVAGLEGLSREAAQVEIDKVAQRIRALGLGAKVVVGASQQEVSFWVPGYVFGTSDPEGLQEIRDLGWVTQTFTVLGADQWTAATTAAVVSSAGIILLALVVLGLVVIMLLVRPGRVRAQTLLRGLGYNGVQRMNWALRESWLGLVCLVIGAVASVVLSVAATRVQTLLVVGVVLLAVLLAIPFTRSNKQRLPSKFGLRRTITGISILESVIAAVCGVIIFALVQVAIWFWETGSKLSLSRLVLESLLPLTVMVLVVLAFLVYLQFVAAGFYQRILQARVVFAYEMLAQPQWRVMLRQVLLLVARFVLVVVLLGVAAWYGLQWVEPEVGALLAVVVWLVAWLLVRVVAVWRMAPVRLLYR